MSIEQHLTELKEAIERNTAALVALSAAGVAVGASAVSAATSAADKPAKGAKAATKSSEPAVTQDQVNAALIKLKDDFGMDHAKAIITDIGKVTKMAEIKPATYQAVYNAAVAKHAELTAAASGAGEDDGI